MIDFMAVHFGFHANETVAIMGAHMIGRALLENSRLDGERGWMNDEFDLGNYLVLCALGNFCSLESLLSQ